MFVFEITGSLYGYRKGGQGQVKLEGITEAKTAFFLEITRVICTTSPVWRVTLQVQGDSSTPLVYGLYSGDLGYGLADLNETAVKKIRNIIENQLTNVPV